MPWDVQRCDQLGDGGEREAEHDRGTEDRRQGRHPGALTVWTPGFSADPLTTHRCQIRLFIHFGNGSEFGGARMEHLKAGAPGTCTPWDLSNGFGDTERTEPRRFTERHRWTPPPSKKQNVSVLFRRQVQIGSCGWLWKK